MQLTHLCILIQFNIFSSSFSFLLSLCKMKIFLERAIAWPLQHDNTCFVPGQHTDVIHIYAFFFFFTYIFFYLDFHSSLPPLPPLFFFLKAVATVHSSTKNHVAHTCFMKTKHKVMRRLRTFMTPCLFYSEVAKSFCSTANLSLIAEGTTISWENTKQVLLNYTVEEINSGLSCLLPRNSSAVAHVNITVSGRFSSSSHSQATLCMCLPHSRHGAVPLGHGVINTPTALSQSHSIPSSKRIAVAMGRAADRQLIPDGVYASKENLP